MNLLECREWYDSNSGLKGSVEAVFVHCLMLLDADSHIRTQKDPDLDKKQLELLLINSQIATPTHLVPIEALRIAHSVLTLTSQNNGWPIEVPDLSKCRTYLADPKPKDMSK